MWQSSTRSVTSARTGLAIRTCARPPRATCELPQVTWSALCYHSRSPQIVHRPCSKQTSRSHVHNQNFLGVHLSRSTSTSTTSTKSINSVQQNPFPTVYTPPTSGPISYLPASLVPYAELSRLDKPIGTYYLFLPCIFSTLLAAPLTVPITSPMTVLGTSFLFFSGALIMRGAGCTINDIWDRKLDPHVARTRLRPLARGAITLPSAIAWTGTQLLMGLAVLLQFPSQCFWYATPSLLLVALYPAAKRVTNYPQLVLGLTFSWGAIVGFPALGLDLLAGQAAAAYAALALYGSNVAWTVLYDMVYAHMDIKDDKIAGINSIARAHEGDTKAVLAGLAVVQAGLLGVAGAASGAGWVYYLGVVGGSLVGNGLQIWKVRLEDAASCWWWFRRGVWVTGGTIVIGMSAEYGMRYAGLYDTSEDAEAASLHNG